METGCGGCRSILATSLQARRRAVGQEGALGVRARTVRPFLLASSSPACPSRGSPASIEGCYSPALLQGSVQVALVDSAFLNAMARRVDTLICWSHDLPSTSRDMTICCNAFLRAGLDVQSPLFQDMLRVIARGFARPSPFQAALVASCLGRLRQADDVLLKGAERAVCAASTKDPKALIQCSMVLHAIATLRPQRRPEALEEILLELLQGSHLTDGGLCQQALQRSCLAILQAEVKWADAQDRPSALIRSVAERLQGLAPAEPWRVGRAGLRTAARALGRWGHSCEPLAETAPRFLEALERKLPSAEREHAGLPPSVLLECLGSAVPFVNHSNGRRSAQKIFKHLVEKAATLRAGQLVALAELSALWQASGMHDEESDDDDQMKKPLRHQIASLGAELYRRSRELPLRAIPRALAALLQLVPAESQEADFLPLLRRCTGRLGYRLGELLDANAAQHERLEDFDIDALGEVLYVCAAAGYTDDSFLETSKRWVLHDNAADLKEMRRNVTAIHLLHSFSLLKVARGDLLHRLVAEAKGKLEQFSAFEVLGFLDAAAILQAESDKPVPSAFIFDESDQQGPPPSGIGEEALHAVLQRLSELLPLLDDEELYTCLNLASSIRLPEGCTLSDMEQEAAKRGMLEAEKWIECQSKLDPSTLHAASSNVVHHVVASSKAYTGQVVCDTGAFAMC
ncbi:unnamed protein product [Symbiodinium sp. CCMP2592]|nr:unnamed protein product [Symbiodinium sp. CCMP2592]